MTHVLFITPYYPPEKAAPAVRISETAKCLVNKGYQVTVLTTVPNYPSGIVPPEYRGRILQCEVRNGVQVVRVWSYVTPNKGFLRRIIAQLSFGCLSPLLGGKAVGRPDIIIVESPPLFDAIAARLLAYLKRCPFIFTVADLWPESAVQLGMLRNKLLIRLAEWLEWSTYKRAGAVWVVTRGIRDTLIRRGLPPEKVFLLTNGVDITKFRPLPKVQARAELGWDDRYTVLYAGTYGLSHGLNTVLDAAEQMRDHPDIHIVLVGDGAARSDLIAQAKRLDLKNVTFLASQPHDIMPTLLSAADACLVHLRKIALFEGALPSKAFEAMACGRPILLGVDGEARRLVEQEAGAAMYFEPENASALASTVLYLRDHPDLAQEMGQRGRAFVTADFDRYQLTKVLETHMEMLFHEKVVNAPVGVLAEASAIVEKS